MFIKKKKRTEKKKLNRERFPCVKLLQLLPRIAAALAGAYKLLIKLVPAVFDCI